MADKRAPYFATLDPEDLGPQVLSRVEDYAEHRIVSQVESRIYDAWLYYYGFSPEGFHATSGVSRGGDQGELAEIRVNHARALVNALLNLIVAPKFVWTPRAVSIDYDAVRQTELAANVLEYFWHTGRVSAYVTKATEESIPFSEGFVMLEWDPTIGDVYGEDPNTGEVVRTGNLRFSNPSTWDVIRNPGKKSWDDLDWVIVRQWRNKYNLAARFPNAAEEILSTPPETNRRFDTKKATHSPFDDEDIPVYYFFHKPSAALPFGRQAIILPSKHVVEDGPLDMDHIPLYRVTPAEFNGTPYGYTQFFEILGIQELTDSLHTSIATNLSTFGTQNIAAEEGTNIDTDDLAGGMRVHYYRQGSKPPEPLMLAKVPEEGFRYLEDLKQHQELLMGLNAVVRGEAQSDRLSGAALALLQSQALQQASVLQGNYIRMIEAIGSGVIQMIRNKAEMPIKVAIAGKHKLARLREAEIDKDSLASVNQVYVEVGNPMSQTAAGRFELGQLLVQMQMVRSPEMLQQVLDTGRLDPLTRSEQEEQLNLLRENEMISLGQTPVAMIHDNHLLHGKEHAVPVATPEARQDPQVLKAFREHMHSHYSLFYGVPPEMVETDPLYRDRMLLLMGQQPPPPMMPPGMMPPPGPGGPPPPGPDGPQPNVNPGEVDALMATTNPAAPNPEQLPNMPTNPATGASWDPMTGGGSTTPGI